jgi:hypothetical protein
MSARGATCSQALRAIALAVVLQMAAAGPAPADALADFQATVTAAEAQLRIAMTTLATRGQAETAREVQRLRQAWQELAAGFNTIRIADDAADQELAAGFVHGDVRLVGVLLVIELGNREAAQDGLAPMVDMLRALRARVTPR